MKSLKILLFVGLIAFSGCKKYLEEEPTKQASIQTAEQLEAMINNADHFCYDGTAYTRSGGSNWSAGFSTDDTEIRMDAFQANPDRFALIAAQHYTFKTQEVIGAPSDELYRGAYRQIFNANVVLTYADEVTGDPKQLAELKADAHFIRGYCYWLLANHYCLPYKGSESDREQGLVLKTKTEYDEPLQRATLKQTYDFILADMQEAAKTSRADVDASKPWRVSKKAVDAFLSRYYLFIGNYDQSLVHTNNALGSNTARLEDFHAIVAGRVESYTNPSNTLNYSALNNWGANKYFYWKEFYIPRFTSLSTQMWLPSPNLLSLYDQSNDLRFKWFMIPNGNRRSNITSHSFYRYTVFNDGLQLPTGPTVAEMLLNKAEILARKGDATGAMNAVNLLREKRMSNPAPLAAANKEEAIQKVLEERRREFPFIFRWYDIRRFSVNDYPADDVTVTRTFFQVTLDAVNTSSTQVYTLQPGSRRFAVPINGVEIQNSRGAITQNQY